MEENFDIQPEGLVDEVAITAVEDVLGDGMSRIELIQFVGSDKIVVNAARVSYSQDNNKPFDARDKKLLKYLMEHEHTSVLEHTYVTFAVEAPLYIAVQWVRHRMSSFNMESHRYVKVKEGRYYTPKIHRLQHKVNKQGSYFPNPNGSVILPDGKTMPYSVWNNVVNDVYREAYETTQRLYKELLDLGVAKESARGILPVSQYTKFYYSANLRSLLHFCDLRLGDGAQWEIQEYARHIVEMLRKLFPNVIAEWEEQRNRELQQEVNNSRIEEMTLLVSGMQKTLVSLTAQLEQLQLDTSAA